MAKKVISKAILIAQVSVAFCISLPFSNMARAAFIEQAVNLPPSSTVDICNLVGFGPETFQCQSALLAKPQFEFYSQIAPDPNIPLERVELLFTGSTDLLLAWENASPSFASGLLDAAAGYGVCQGDVALCREPALPSFLTAVKSETDTIDIGDDLPALDDDVDFEGRSAGQATSTIPLAIDWNLTLEEGDFFNFVSGSGPSPDPFFTLTLQPVNLSSSPQIVFTPFCDPAVDRCEVATKAVEDQSSIAGTFALRYHFASPTTVPAPPPVALFLLGLALLPNKLYRRIRSSNGTQRGQTPSRVR